MPKGQPIAVKKSLEKSRDSALLAIESYNKPAVKFKSGGYIVLMIIAWTALFHAIFFKRKIKPFYKEKNGIRYVRRKGDFSYWELGTCLKEYFGADVNNPIRKNLDFFIPLRNMIEHKSLPEIDSDIFAECQSLLLNYDKILEKEFGEKYCIRELLSFALQLYPSSKSLSNAIEKNPSVKSVADFITSYRSSITTDILETGEYSFKAFLIQVTNHESKDTLPIQFIQYDKLTEEEKKAANRIAALVKHKTIPVASSNLLKPADVVSKVQEGLGNLKVTKGKKTVDKFNLDTHTRCWKKYKVRPQKGDSNPSKTKSEFCVYDELNTNYGYTEKWVQFLIKEMSNDEEYNILFDK
jgi:hypothetical protein